MSNRQHNDRDHQRDEEPIMYSIFRGEIARVQPYGVFVRIPGSRKQGLVHRSQMSKVKVEKPEEVVDAGDSVFCKIISIDEEDGKIGLSMKVVNQTTGDDMDTNHVQSSLDEQKRKSGGNFREKAPIELGAVLDTTCKKCGCKGHLAQDCFHQTGGKTYDLLPDVDHLMEEAKSQVDAEGKTKHSDKMKHKKEKKVKKHKRHKRDSSSDSDKKVKKHKKHKRHRTSSSAPSPSQKDKRHKEKRRKRRYSETSSSSSDSSSSSGGSDTHSGAKHRKKHKSHRS